jgi:hypothetical protein
LAVICTLGFKYLAPRFINKVGLPSLPKGGGWLMGKSRTLSALALSLSVAAAPAYSGPRVIFSQESIDRHVAAAMKGEDELHKNFSINDKPGRTFDKKFALVAAFTYGSAGYDPRETGPAMRACQ